MSPTRRRVFSDIVPDWSPWFRLLLAVLATWRLARLIAKEDGPFDIIVRLRQAAGQGVLGALMDLPLLPQSVVGCARRVHGGTSAGCGTCGLVFGLAGDIGRGMLFGELARAASGRDVGCSQGLST